MTTDFLDETTQQVQEQKTPKKLVKERQFKGMSLSERKLARREKLIEAGIETYGTHGFFSVTVKDVCIEAKLTERYFYESFKKSEELFQTIFLQLVDQLQHTVMQGVMQSSPDPKPMIHSGLMALFSMLKADPRVARIIYVDAMLVQELHNHATIHETMGRFDRINGYVTQVAVRWVMGGFKLSVEQVVFACEAVFFSLLNSFSEKQSA